MLNPYNPSTFEGVTRQSQVPNNEIYAKVLFAQMALETGNGSSNLFKNHNNLFGMRPAQSREKFYQDVHTTSGNGQFASYDAPLYSVQDRMDLDSYFNNPPPNDEGDILRYMHEVMNNGYVPKGDRKEYLELWAKIFAANFPTIPLIEFFAPDNPPVSTKAIGSAVTLLLVGVGGFFLYKRFKK